MIRVLGLCSSTECGEGTRGNSRVGPAGVHDVACKLADAERRLQRSRETNGRLAVRRSWMQVHKRLPFAAMVKQERRVKGIFRGYVGCDAPARWIA